MLLMWKIYSLFRLGRFQCRKLFVYQRVNVKTVKPLQFIWLVVEPYPSEKYDFVSWDDKIPNVWKKKIHVPKQQIWMISYDIMILCIYRDRPPV